MALDKSTLTSDLLTIYQESGQTDSQVAAQVADAIDKFVRSGTVSTVLSVTNVTGVTPGVAVSGPGAGTGTGQVT